MGYSDPPWTFKGRALYQLQLVKSEEARKYIPDTFKLVELFGEARDHGLQCVGLPSRLATFTCLPPTAASLEPGLASAAMAQPAHSPCWWRGCPATPAISSHPAPAACCTSAGGRGHGSLPTPLQGGKADGAAGAAGSTLPLQPAVLLVSNVDQRGRRARSFPVCTLLLPPGLGEGSFPGPRLRLSLPSYSGATPDCPALLKYACHLHTNIGVMAPARVSLPLPEAPDLAVGRRPRGRAGGEGSEEDGELMTAVLGGRPLLALNFHDMEMTVHQPIQLPLLPLATQS
ncbi:hypothetical protein QJQ45_011231 [Haematococcus lacustris]|nr:hypothetical protein QJQ45_011231 [Haematococcus lacustris]